MKYSIKTPLMAADFPNILDALFGGDIKSIVKDAVERFTVDEQGNLVSNPAASMSPRDYIALVNEASRVLGFVSEEGNA